MTNKINISFKIDNIDICDTGFIQASQFIRDKILSVVKHLENHFHVVIDFTFSSGNPLTINGMTPVDITLKKDYVNGQNSFLAEFSNHSIKFKVKFYDFSLSNESEFIIHFNSNLELENLTVMSTRKDFSKKELQFLVLTFDKSLKLLSVHHTNNFQQNLIEKHDSMLLPYSDELQLFRIRESDKNELLDDFPEFYIPSAYNFESEDFKNRLAVYEMMTT